MRRGDLMQHAACVRDQVEQVRGYADQHLRKPDDPNDSSNRRISMIVQYLDGEPGKLVREGPVAAEKSEGGEHSAHETSDSPPKGE